MYNRIAQYNQEGMEWEIDHLVCEASRKIIIIGRAGEDYIIFLVDEHTGCVCRQLEDGSWEELVGSIRYSVIARLIAAQHRNIPTYSIQ